MANFCRSCGCALNPHAAFCPQCGNSAAASAPPAAASPAAGFQPPPPVAAPVASSSSGLKIILVIVCILVVAGIAVMGGVYYAVHRVKQAVAEKAHEYGVDLPAGNSSIASISPDILKNPCKLISISEVSGLIGEPIERTTVQDSGCLYFGPPGLSYRLGKDGMSNMINKPGNAVTPGQAADTIDRMMKGVAAQAGQGGVNGEAPLLTIILSADDGRSQMAAINVSKAMLNGLAGASEEVAGLGDRAVRLGNLGLNVLKGNSMLRILPGPIPDANQKSIAVARVVLPRM